MKKYIIFFLFALIAASACTHQEANDKSRHIYIITTNDIHANINMMPQLSTLVREYEQLGDVILTDSGDRVTGNAFVDDHPQPGIPMIELMNAVGYDVVTLGNHEFDKGAEVLAEMITTAEFSFVCANLTTPEDYPAIEPYTLIEFDNFTLGIAGIVDTDGNGHPLGGDEAYAPFRFTTDVTTAYEISAEVATKSDFSILLSHMGIEQDRALANLSAQYNWIAGGHSHDTTLEQINNCRISQNGKNLHYATIADIELADGEIINIDYEQVSVSAYDADPCITAIVAQIKSQNPEMCAVEGYANALATQDGVANFTIDALASYPYDDSFTPEITFYHFGGIRLSNLLAGDITRGDIYNNDPFQSTIYIGAMTPAEIRRFILDKYNSGSVERPDKESHYAYFRSDLPYTIVLGDTPAAQPDAIDILFDLEDGRSYRVAMCNYIAENYIDKEFVARSLRRTNVSVREAMLHHLHTMNEGFTPDNTIYQIEVHHTDINR